MGAEQSRKSRYPIMDDCVSLYQKNEKNFQKCFLRIGGKYLFQISEDWTLKSTISCDMICNVEFLEKEQHKWFIIETIITKKNGLITTKRFEFRFMNRETNKVRNMVFSLKNLINKKTIESFDTEDYVGKGEEPPVIVDFVNGKIVVNGVPWSRKPIKMPKC